MIIITKKANRNVYYTDGDEIGVEEEDKAYDVAEKEDDDYEEVEGKDQEMDVEKEEDEKDGEKDKEDKNVAILIRMGRWEWGNDEKLKDGDNKAKENDEKEGDKNEGKEAEDAIFCNMYHIWKILRLL